MVFFRGAAVEVAQIVRQNRATKVIHRNGRKDEVEPRFNMRLPATQSEKGHSQKREVLLRDTSNAERTINVLLDVESELQPTFEGRTALSCCYLWYLSVTKGK